MADGKKYNGSTWEHSLRKLGTATDTLTTLPIDIYADGTTATVGLKGNTVQSGTPTPDNPIMPQGTGERTENLFNTILPSMNIDGSGKIIADNQFDLWIAQVTAGEEYTASAANGCYAFYASKPSAGSISIDGSRIISYFQRTFTVPNGANYIAVRYNKNSTSKMCNTGSTLLPYEPYGIKIPILSASTTTPVYLGDVETTRKIYKLVLTGQESWNVNSTGNTQFFYTTVSNETIPNSEIICTHFEKANIGQTTTVVGIGFAGTVQLRVRPENTSAETLISFNQWLIDQYANGTPVTVWYVLATETTGIVDEPIRKIGDYADTVSGITIPTIAGADSFDVLTTLKPSEVELTYTGWHDATVEEWDGSEWQ